MPVGVDTSNGSLMFTRPLEQNDSGQYRCDVWNNIGQSFQDVRILILGEKFYVSTNACDDVFTLQGAKVWGGTLGDRLGSDRNDIHTHLCGFLT